MNNFFKLITLILILNINSVMAKITQSIDRKTISAGETFVLDIRVDNASDVSPDLSMIPADITIVSNSQYQQTQIINGKRSSIKGWKLKLKTLKPGVLVIPAISIGNESTKPIRLDIKESSFKVDVNGQKDAIFLTAKVDQETPFVQQQIIYTVSLYRAISTHYENLSAPEVENSIIEKLGDDVVFDKMIDNRRYSVYQRKYIIFPQKSGEIVIGPVNFTADVNDSGRQSRSLFLNSTRPISVSTKSVTLKVKAKPDTAATPWLPAESVALADSWTENSANKPNSQPSDQALQLKVGEPVTWTLYLSVQGLSESQLPELSLPKVTGLQMYPDAPLKERQVNDKGILGKRVEKFAVIPSKPGPLTIPAVELKWWDTKNNIEKTATLPSRTFNVLPADIIEQAPVTLPPMPVAQTQPSQTDQADVQKWQYISIALLTLWLITLIAYFLKKGKATSANNKTTPVNQAKIKNDNQQQALKRAKRTLKNGTADEIAEAILNMVNTHTANQLHSLGVVAHKIQDLKLAEKINDLEKQRFSATQQSSQFLLSSEDLNKIIEQISAQPENAGSSSIPPLYAR